MDIAITGFSFLLPGASNLEELDALLESGQDALTDPLSSYNPREGWVSRAGYVEGVDQFDYDLFGVSLRDSYIIEPQQRMFIQCAWRALEQAGYNPTRCALNVGVYSSSSDSHYRSFLSDSQLALDKYDPFEIEIGSNKEQQSLRCAYLFDLKGPAVGVQSACSSGLLSVHMAMQGIATGDCEMAIAGGACLPYPLHSGYQYQPGMNLSESGVLSSYSHTADGMVPGFGCVVFVLKALDKARSDKDTVYGVLTASSINNDGRAKSSYTAPSTSGIARNIQNVLAKSALTAQDIDFVEGHGSGTKIGDVLEVAALKKAFISHELATNNTALSSIKANIGHLDVVAGHAGLLKSVLQVWNHKLYPAANFSSLNPNVQLEQTPFYIPTEIRRKEKLTGLVNSLGIGGTNCALVIRGEERSSLAGEGSSQMVVVMIGANNSGRLQHLLSQLQKALKNASHSLEDVAYTLTRRSVGKGCIATFAVASLSELQEQIATTLRSGVVGHPLDVCLKEYKGKAIAINASEIDAERVVMLESTPKPQTKTDEAPREETLANTLICEEALRKIWLDNFMLDSIKEEDSFAELGGHSILALSLVTDINAALNLTLTMDWVEKYDVFSAQLNELNRLARTKTASSLVKTLFVPPGETRATLILVHASISGVEMYKKMSKNIASDIEVLGVDSYNLYNENKITSIDRLAETYADDILERVKDNTAPVFIGGWSLGGLLAIKITKLLIKKIKIKGNILLDSVLYSQDSSVLFTDDYLSCFMDLSYFSNSITGDERARDNLKSLFDIERNMVKEFDNPRLNLPLLNVVATSSLVQIKNNMLSSAFESLKKANNNWPVSDLMMVKEINTDHVGLMTELNVNEVSGFIREFLEQHV
ncbi:beta-ketoacyl synthase N-terminal-like domain-containing protein [Serratia plymuthica]|uniref:beta-ketoacyl synthase N-terminal-like domain-containing protein n=1 Tax=Serratia plymuthica TaxID=82996 RepID=UPI003DA4014A